MQHRCRAEATKSTAVQQKFFMQCDKNLFSEANRLTVHNTNSEFKLRYEYGYQYQNFRSSSCDWSVGKGQTNQ